MKPTLQEFLSMTAHRRVPLYQELYADSYTPVEVLRMLKRVSSHCFLLESVEDNHKWGRYSFLGYDPSMEVVCRGGCLQIRSGQKIIQEVVSHPKEVLKELKSVGRNLNQLVTLAHMGRVTVVNLESVYRSFSELCGTVRMILERKRW